VNAPQLEALLDEQVAYYRALAPEYFDRALPYLEASAKELTEALDDFRPAGDVLEFACGPGTWTPRLTDHADTLTCVDASPEMLAAAERRVGSDKVRFERADIFSWRPERRYDVVFFGFWLSHVPPERFDAFWSLVADCLKPDGRVFFVDDGYRAPDELIGGEDSLLIRRRLHDGSAYRIVKVPLEPAELELRLRELGWSIEVRPTTSPGPFFWGSGTPMSK
jgi:SAM-dependent methyltransferase